MKRRQKTLSPEQARSRARNLRARGQTASQIAQAVGRSESWVYANTKQQARKPAKTAPLGSSLTESAQQDEANSPREKPKKDSLLRYDARPEDLLDQEALDEIDRKYAASEANFQRHREDGTIEERLLTVDDLRELAERARQGEQISLTKT